MRVVETTHITIGQWSQIDKDNTKLSYTGSQQRQDNHSIALIFLIFKRIRKKHEQSINIEHHKMNSISQSNR